MPNPWDSLKTKHRFYRGRPVAVAEEIPEVDWYCKLERFKPMPYEKTMAWKLNADFSPDVGFDYKRAWLLVLP